MVEVRMKTNYTLSLLLDPEPADFIALFYAPNPRSELASKWWRLAPDSELDISLRLMREEIKAEWELLSLLCFDLPTLLLSSCSEYLSQKRHLQSSSTLSPGQFGTVTGWSTLSPGQFGTVTGWGSFWSHSRLRRISKKNFRVVITITQEDGQKNALNFSFSI